jgi:integrase
LRRSPFGTLWRRTRKDAGVTGRTFHSLRHYYASLLTRHGESVTTVQAGLGHASAAETLDTYSHLWPDSGGRTREAVDQILGGARTPTSSAARGS